MSITVLVSVRMECGKVLERNWGLNVVGQGERFQWTEEEQEKGKVNPRTLKTEGSGTHIVSSG